MKSQTHSMATQIPFTEGVDLASEKVGGVALLANDEFFAPKENLLKAVAPVFIPDKYTEFGKWMDGWETRRKRTSGHDWCVIQLGLPGEIHGVNVDTAHFLGNHPEQCSIEACAVPENQSAKNFDSSAVPWQEILPKTKLFSGCANLIPIHARGRFTHLRLNIYPDGGVARLRVYGEVKPDWKKLRAMPSALGSALDLAAVENGGKVVTCNDMFFGPKENLILPGRATTMGEGWETRRKRGPGHDWIVIRLGTAGKIQKLEIDTNHFKGNFPESCSLEGSLLTEQNLGPIDFIERRDLPWQEILPRTQLQGHHRHFFEKELHKKTTLESFNFIRLNIFPDGGISRLRVYGVPAEGLEK